MRFLIDHNVPKAAADYLRDRGHDVALVGDLMPVDSPDHVVATAAMANDRVLVSHDRDMRHIERKLSAATRERYGRLSRLQLCCPEPMSAARIECFIEVIEAEFNYLAGGEIPLQIDIGESRARFSR